MSIVGLMLVKSDSSRLPNKNTLPVKGVPMFVVNLKKCLKIFDRVYVSSENLEILDTAMKLGAIPIKRPKNLCGDTPNITVYKHALREIPEEKIVAVQANSPTIDIETIKSIKMIMAFGFNEVMTCHKDYSIYGSVWALTSERIRKYKDPYKPTPEVLVVDNSIDIHSLEDYNKVIQYYEK